MLCVNRFREFLRPIVSFSNVRRNLFYTPPEESPTFTISQATEDFYVRLGTSKYYKDTVNLMEQRRKLMELLPKDRSELPPRSMKDSFASVIVPLKSDIALRERYMSASDTIRIGRLLEDLDILAGYCCYQHIVNPRSTGKLNPYSCVTALVDKITVSPNSFKIDEDVRISGHVSWVGKSSMEVSMLIDQRNDQGKWTKFIEALFLFVARDPMNQGPALVNTLMAETPEEKAFIAKGEERCRNRKLAASEALTNKAPNTEEIEILHNIFKGYDENAANTKEKTIPENARRMADCHFNTLLLGHPQHRNRFNKIFGGFIMRQAFEIALSSAYLYSKSKGKVVYVDDILFRKPVEVGSLLSLHASVGYVEGQFMHVPVVAEVLKPETNEKSITNVFQFTFLSLGEPPPIVLPNSYLEAMVYLDARRHFKQMMSDSKVCV